MQKRNVAVVLQRPGPGKDGSGNKVRVLARFRMIRSAVNFIEARAKRDPDGVKRGDYGIDAPEHVRNPRR